MATTNGNTTHIFGSNNGNEINRQEIQEAIAKAVELRALHAALMQGNITPIPRFPSSTSPLTRPSSQFSAQDYPVFTPSYQDQPPPGYQLETRTLSENWDNYGFEGENDDETALSDYKNEISSSRKVLPYSLTLEPHNCPSEDQKSVASTSGNHVTVLQTSPAMDFFKSGRRSSRSTSSCNKCKPAIISTNLENPTKNHKNSNIIVPLTDSHGPIQSGQHKTKGPILSWLFPKLKKKHKSETSPNRTECEEVSQVFKDSSKVSIEALKKELMEANNNRDAALMEVTQMKSSLEDLKQKLDYLEKYCEELKKALAKNLPIQEKRAKSIDGNRENSIPVSEEVMIEGFLQIVSEARLSVKQFCKTLVGQIEETDNTLTENLNSLLQPHKLSLNSKYSKAVLYHLEAIINLLLYQDFENCVFQKNGSAKNLDLKQDRESQFSSFVALRNLSWNEVLRKGTKYYSEEFSKFCDQKMGYIISTLNWTRPWPEPLLQSFFVAAKCVWLLHLLAFSFDSPLGILRVEENQSFDSKYMEDVFVERQRSQGPSRVKIMVMPGFYIQDKVLRCKVLCSYKPMA